MKKGSTLLVILALMIGSLCLAEAAPAVYSGFIEVNPKYGANLYYYFLESQGSPKTDPVVLWLQGGPGCSSLFGLFVENGPNLIKADGTFQANPWSWNTNASVIYIDSPVGSGYSYVKNSDGYATNEKTIGEELYTALYTFFFQLHPEYSKLDFYIFGESYAGKYVPWLGWTVLNKNKNAPNKINLKGLGVGDGWVNPYYQTGSYAPYLYQNNLINSLELETANGVYELYAAAIDAGLYEVAQDFGNALLGLLVAEAGNVDVYDIRYTNGDPTDPLQDALTTYLNQPDVRKKMNAGNQEWQACADQPYFELLDDIARSSEFLFPPLLQNYRVLLYNGDKDLICNMIGTTTWASKINWPYQSEFNNAKNMSWSVASKPAGYYKTAKTLTHLIVYNAGHMVPFDQAQNSHDFLYRFIRNGF